MDLLDRLLGHDAWTTRLLLERCRALDASALDREFPIGHRTLRRTLGHIVRNVEAWGGAMAGVPVATWDGQAERDTASPPTPDQLIARLDRAAAVLAGVARDVARRHAWDERWRDSAGEPPEGLTYGGAIAHVITHSMHHRAQVIAMLRQLGIADVPEGDVLGWEAQAPQATQAAHTAGEGTP